MMTFYNHSESMERYRLSIFKLQFSLLCFLSHSSIQVHEYEYPSQLYEYLSGHRRDIFELATFFPLNNTAWTICFVISVSPLVFRNGIFAFQVNAVYTLGAQTTYLGRSYQPFKLLGYASTLKVCSARIMSQPRTSGFIFWDGGSVECTKDDLFA